MHGSAREASAAGSQRRGVSRSSCEACSGCRRDSANTATGAGPAGAPSVTTGEPWRQIDRLPPAAHALPNAPAARLAGSSRIPGRLGLTGLWPGGLLSGALDWILARPCPLCRQLLPPTLSSENRGRAGLCGACSQRLSLPEAGLSGRWPLPWWSSGAYSGALRQTLLDQKCRRPDAAVLKALLQPLLAGLQALQLPLRGPKAVLLVPIPGWRRRPNPLPGLIADQLAGGLGLRRRDLLERSRPVLGQHRLGRQLRQANQEGSFQLSPTIQGRRPAPVLLVDDILTTGSTLRQASLCLEQAGWQVLGAACLARTPDRRDWLRTP